MTDWNRVRHFVREEWKNFPDAISSDVVYLLDEVRGAAGAPLVIHVAADQGGHVEDSSHYFVAREFACAVDFHIQGMSLLEQWLLVERFPWNGIGLYPHWNTPGVHVDLRRLGRDHPHLGKRWWRDKDGTYKPIDKQLLKLLLENEK